MKIAIVQELKGKQYICYTINLDIINAGPCLVETGIYLFAGDCFVPYYRYYNLPSGVITDVFLSIRVLYLVGSTF